MTYAGQKPRSRPARLGPIFFQAIKTDYSIEAGDSEGDFSKAGCVVAQPLLIGLAYLIATKAINRRPDCRGRKQRGQRVPLGKSKLVGRSVLL